LKTFISVGCIVQPDKIQRCIFMEAVVIKSEIHFRQSR
jgi:hypothetical protein